jgi:hypothetical protein
MDDAFGLATEAAASSDATVAQRGQLVAGLSAMDMGRPDAESWLTEASNGPDREVRARRSRRWRRSRSAAVASRLRHNRCTGQA